jgi:hypothetical protein
VLAAEANSIITIRGHSDRHDSSLLSINNKKEADEKG